MAGFPREAAELDNDHLPFRAFYAPNRDYRNPIRCCGGLLFDWFSIQEDVKVIDVAYANTKEHLLCWPKEIRSAWLRAGGPEITTYTLKDSRAIALPPKDGDWMKAEMISKNSDSCYHDPE